jgi:hypothetical protein
VSDVVVTCDAGQKAISGGFDASSGLAFAFDTRPSPDGRAWGVLLANPSDGNAASGTAYAVCVR